MMIDKKTLKASTGVSAVLQGVERLPSLSFVVFEIMQSINREEIDVTVLANKIATDQGILARVLRVANSPFYGLSGKIDTVSRAVSVLGFNSLRGLVMASAIMNAFPDAETKIDWLPFWRHSICVAACAKVLAKHAGLNPETAFTAGILHDIGKLAIGFYFPQAFYAGNIAGDTRQYEFDQLGFDHADLGGEVARRWRFPTAIQQAIEYHHIAERTPARDLADVVFIANRLARILENGDGGEDGMPETLTAEAAARLDCRGDKLDSLAGEAQRLFESFVGLIG